MALDESTGQVRVHKTSNTPDDPAAGVVEAVLGLPVPLDEVTVFMHGTTLGLNAVLQRRGAATGLITNAGFRDVLEIGRGDVPERQMYDLQGVRPRPLISRRHIATVTGRIDARGAVAVALDEAEARQAAQYLVTDCGLQSLAVCFLHSYANPGHELRVREIIKDEFPQVPVTLSVDVAREYREYERTSSTVIAAYIRPLIDRYLEKLESELRRRGFRGSFWVMRSACGAMSASFAREAPLASLFSGPAGGIAATSYIAAQSGQGHLISFDVGGTSLDSCVIHAGGPAQAYEAKLEHMPMLGPVFDLRTIGAGGGSIAHVDDGFLKVGPESAGAVPGPSCYLRGGSDATLTDAAAALGYLRPQNFLAGRMEISVPAARKALTDNLAGQLGLGIDQTAAGIFRVAVSRTVGALREITIERGLDPRDFHLVAFGGCRPDARPDDHAGDAAARRHRSRRGRRAVRMGNARVRASARRVADGNTTARRGHVGRARAGLRGTRGHRNADVAGAGRPRRGDRDHPAGRSPLPAAGAHADRSGAQRGERAGYPGNCSTTST